MSIQKEHPSEASTSITHMKELFNVLGIQMFYVDKTEDITKDFDYSLRNSLFTNYPYQNLFTKLNDLLIADVLYYYEDPFRLNYVFYRFPQDSPHSNSILILGPVLFQPISPELLRSILEDNRIPLSKEQDFNEYYHQIPMPLSLDHLSNLVYFFLTKITGTTPTAIKTDSNHLFLFQEEYFNYSIEENYSMQGEIVEKRYYWEREFMRCVSKGNLNEALAAHSKFSKYRLPNRVSDPIRNRKNFSLILNTLLRTAAEQGGVYSLHIDNLSRQIHAEIESLYSIPMLDALSKNMIRKYCMLVNNYSRTGYPELIKKCMNYIDFHYHEDLSLHSLASMNYVSDSYLSSLFKKSTSVSLIDYINSIRIKQSLVLLNSTDLSIEEIATHCGYSEYNYFTRVFKKFNHLTPRDYRKQIVL